MDRRKSLKLMAWSSVAGSLLLDACQTPAPKDTVGEGVADVDLDRMPEETAAYKKVVAETFFTAHELQTITVLADIIIPADEVSGSASEAGVPRFIEFMVKEMPELQTPMRGGLRWLDLFAARSYQASFVACSPQQQIAMVDQVAYPRKARPGMQAGVAFFNLMRDLTASGFYTSQIGITDIGYAGNKPNQWNGVPQDVLQRYGLSYSEKENKECAHYG